MNEKSTAEGLPKPAKNSARALLASVVTAEISDMCTPRVKVDSRALCSIIGGRALGGSVKFQDKSATQHLNGPIHT